MRWLLSLLLAPTLPAVAGNGWLPVEARLGAYIGHTGNLSRSALPSDETDAANVALHASIGHSRQLTRNLLGRAEFDASAFFVESYPLNNRASLGPRISAQHKFGLGPFAPVLRAEIGVQQRLARAPGDRGTTSEAALTIGQRLHPAWRVSATADWSGHAARSPAFDVDYRRLHGAVHWDITDRWQAAAGGGQLSGFFTANASWPVWKSALSGALGPVVQTYYANLPWRETDLFGARWVTYPVSGRVDFWWAELAPALGPRSTLALRYERADSVNRIGIKYRQETWTLGLLLRF